MSDTDNDKPKLGMRTPLGLKRTVETGKVKQSFSHGRSNTVVVEVKRRRILGRPGEPEAAPVEEAAPAPVAPPAPAPVAAPVAAPPVPLRVETPPVMFTPVLPPERPAPAPAPVAAPAPAPAPVVAKAPPPPPPPAPPVRNNRGDSLLSRQELQTKLLREAEEAHDRAGRCAPPRGPGAPGRDRE